MTTVVRDCTEADHAATLAIYDQLVDTTTIAWTERRTTLADWSARVADQRARGFPVLVAERESELGSVVVGLAAYDDFRDTAHWEGYRHTVELSIHVLADQRGRGIGRLLMDALLDRARAQHVHVVVAAIDGDNAESLAFHARLGFAEVARMPEVGFKFGGWHDLVLMQRFVR